jgi:uncharacterized protein YidB (DUF937 family)
MGIEEALMGLLEDVLSGMGGARPQQGAPGAGSQPAVGGMSPIMMAMLALLAQRALSDGLGGAPGRGGGGGLADILGGMLGGGADSGGAGSGGLGSILGGMLGGAPRGAPAGGGALGGGLGDLLGGLLGGAAGGPGSALAGGLGDLMRQFEQNGQGDVAHSWIGRGENRPISSDQLAAALGPDTVSSLADQAGVSQIELLAGLSREMPSVIDRLTPNGRLPTEEEASRWV